MLLDHEKHLYDNARMYAVGVEYEMPTLKDYTLTKFKAVATAD